MKYHAETMFEASGVVLPLFSVATLLCGFRSIGCYATLDQVSGICIYPIETICNGSLLIHGGKQE